MSDPIVHPPGRKWLYRAALLTLLFLACGIMWRTVSLARWQQEAMYPGAIVLATERDSAPPSVLLRQGLVLRSPDESLRIHAWYRDKLGVGQRQSADGPCDHMYANDRVLFAERRVTLTVCDGLDYRTFYVQQGIHFTWQFQRWVDDTLSRLRRPD